MEDMNLFILYSPYRGCLNDLVTQRARASVLKTVSNLQYNWNNPNLVPESRLIQLSLDKMSAILRMQYSIQLCYLTNIFSRFYSDVFWGVSQHWFGLWLGADQLTVAWAPFY